MDLDTQSGGRDANVADNNLPMAATIGLSSRLPLPLLRAESAPANAS